MKYLTLFRPYGGVEGGMPDAEHMAAMGKLIEDSMARGVLIGTEPLAPREACVHVSLKDGKFTVRDVEHRMGGYAFLSAASKDDVVAFTREFLEVAGDGEVEIRQIAEF